MKVQNTFLDAYIAFREYIRNVYLARSEGKLFYPLSIGYPYGNEFRLPKSMLKALCPINKNGEIQRYGYGWNFSSSNLKNAIIDYENTKNNTRYASENIALTAGGSYGINQVVQILQKSGSFDEILVLGPTFFRLFGEISKTITVKSVIGNPENKFMASIEQIKSSLTSKTKAIFLCNPSNPGYTLFPNSQMNELLALVKKKKLILIIDEVGDAFRYENSIDYAYSKKIMSNFVIRICSASKVFMLAEYRLGYVIGPKKFIKELSVLVGDDMGHIPMGPTDGWLYGLVEERKRLLNKASKEYVRSYQKNINILKMNLQAINRFFQENKHIGRIISPDACFSMLIQIKSSRYVTDIMLFKNLIRQKGVSLVPGSAFGINKKLKYFRLTFAVSPKILKKGLGKIKQFIEESCIK